MGLIKDLFLLLGQILLFTRNMYHPAQEPAAAGELALKSRASLPGSAWLLGHARHGQKKVKFEQTFPHCTGGGDDADGRSSAQRVVG